MERIIAHIDMNSYFASVEQQANPLLRGKALGVCAYLHENGCIIAASIEAKLQGMKVGMTVREARKIALGAVFVESDPVKYRSVTTRIFAIFRRVTDKVEPYSIDEAFLDMTGWCRDEAEAAFLLTRIREIIHNEMGEWLPCSIGIAPTKFLAKLASDFKKPNGLTIISREDLDMWLTRFTLEDLPGIGKKMRRQFWGIGIFTPLHLRQANPMVVLRALGKTGYTLWASLNGMEYAGSFASLTVPKSIGHSYCVPERVNRNNQVPATLARLVARMTARLRAKELQAKTISLVIGIHEEDQLKHKQSTLIPQTNDDLILQHQASKLLSALWKNERIRYLAITVSQLSGVSHQMSLPSLQCRRSVSSRIDWRDPSTGFDRVRQRYGEGALFLGREWQAIQESDAPDRIGFRKIDGPGYDVSQ